MLLNMLSKMTTRRELLKGSASAAVLMTIPAAMTVGAVDAGDPQIAAQITHIKSVLRKHTGRAEKIRREYVEVFAQRFTEEYGLVDYKTHYSGLVGEYRLTRLFARSLYLTV